MELFNTTMQNSPSNGWLFPLLKQFDMFLIKKFQKYFSNYLKIILELFR